MTARVPPTLLLKQLAATALQYADGERVVQQALTQQPISGPVRLFALGKAAAAMWRGAARQLGSQLRTALVIAPAPASERDRAAAAVPLQWQLGGHPLPTADSLAAGAAAMAFVRQSAADETLLVLLSGGASSLCDVLVDGVSLSDVRALQQALLAANLPIAAINAVRQSLSQIKAGGLARCCPATVPVRQLVISDVPNDDLQVIGSAPFIVSAVRSVNPDWLPAPWSQWLQQHAPDRFPEPPSSALASVSPRPLAVVQTEVIASNRTVRQALQRQLEQRQPTQELATQEPFTQEQTTQSSWPVVVNQDFAGDCASVTAQIAEHLRRGPPGLYLFGGECHLQLPNRPGRGGRNQHLALSLAVELAGRPEFAVLSLATDGVDGQSDAAGALFESGRWPVTSAQQAEAVAALASASSYDCWQRQGGLLFTGPTGSNVADLLFCLKH